MECILHYKITCFYFICRLSGLASRFWSIWFSCKLVSIFFSKHGKSTHFWFDAGQLRHPWTVHILSGCIVTHCLFCCGSIIPNWLTYLVYTTNVNIFIIITNVYIITNILLFNDLPYFNKISIFLSIGPYKSRS